MSAQDSADQDITTSPPDQLTLATLYLCTISYARDISTIQVLVQNTPPLTQGGSWSLLWGPGQTTDQSNLAFVAGYYLPSGALRSICVTVRGTNIFLGEDIWGILQQIWQDGDATSQVPLPWLPPGDVRIAQGTSEGLTTIQGLTDSRGVSLAKYLTGFLGTASNSNVATVVTGHSLGGCLASVVAPWIQAIRPASYNGIVQPVTFAAPTAGNYAFANYYNTTFKTARRFQNTLDVIPLAFYNLAGIPVMYSPYGLDAPDVVVGGIVGWQWLLNYFKAFYTQPAQGTQLLIGFFLLNDQHRWYAQALHQHHPATYLALLNLQPVDVAALPQSTTVLGTQARLAKHIGAIEAALAQAAAPRAAE